MITKEEAEQFIAMMNWASSEEAIQSMDVRMFKQYNKKDKVNKVMYEITSIEWNNKWKQRRGKGESLIKAMEDYTNGRSTIETM